MIVIWIHRNILYTNLNFSGMIEQYIAKSSQVNVSFLTQKLKIAGMYELPHFCKIRYVAM